jgi:hypothetical protein
MFMWSVVSSLEPSFLRARKVTEIATVAGRTDIIQRHRADPNTMHDVMVGIKPRTSWDALKEMAQAVTDPASAHYGAHYTREQLGELMFNPESSKVVEEYLRDEGAVVTGRSPYDEYLTIRAPITVWERVLQTEFYRFDRTDDEGRRLKPVIRSLHHTVPEDLEPHVDILLWTSQLPPSHMPRSNNIISSSKLASYTGPHLLSDDDYQGAVNPDVLRSYCKFHLYLV